MPTTKKPKTKKTAPKTAAELMAAAVAVIGVPEGYTPESPRMDWQYRDELPWHPDLPIEWYSYRAGRWYPWTRVVPNGGYQQPFYLAKNKSQPWVLVYAPERERIEIPLGTFPHGTRPPLKEAHAILAQTTQAWLNKRLKEVKWCSPEERQAICDQIPEKPHF